jgi:hypothetical protein
MPDAQEQPVEVMLDLYSGRPNPTWTLSEHQVKELRELLAASMRERQGEKVPSPPALGYSGFTLANRRNVEGIPYRVKVYGGVLAVTLEKAEAPEARGRLVFYADRDRLEAWLLEQAKERGYGEAIEKMGGPKVNP